MWTGEGLGGWVNRGIGVVLVEVLGFVGDCRVLRGLGGGEWGVRIGAWLGMKWEITGYCGICTCV